jgi:branched-chain amino acid aminotransferase
MTASTIFELHPVAQPLSEAERASRMQHLGFGRVFTEHMIQIAYTEERGWGQGVLSPYGPLPLYPASSVLHYGQAIFEGFKAYYQPDGGIKTYRPEANARRFNGSARRMAMPELPVELFIEAADTLIRQDRAWVPKDIGEGLYLRPLMIATEAALGVRPSKEYQFVLFASPSGDYFPSGVKPVSVWLSEEYARACPGGTGEAKCAGNYAASLLAQRQAQEEGCDQVVWLDSVHRRYIEEMGGMNIFFVYQEADRVTLVTPELTGTLLEGVTRDGLLQIGRGLGYTVVERKISVEEWQADVRSGRLTETFACGTAAVITPIGEVKSRKGSWVIRGGETGPVTKRLREELLHVQHGLTPDRHGWMHTVI